MHFARTFLNMRALGVRVIAIEEFVNYEKIVYIENILKMAGGRTHTLHPTPWIRTWL